jgi:hypothetical protein
MNAPEKISPPGAEAYCVIVKEDYFDPRLKRASKISNQPIDPAKFSVNKVQQNHNYTYSNL